MRRVGASFLSWGLVSQERENNLSFRKRKGFFQNILCELGKGGGVV